MKLEYLDVYITICDCKSINKAAKKLDRSVQNLSYIVQSLEEELQTTLLVRSYNGVIPTKIGTEFYELALNIHHCFNNFAQSLSENDYTSKISVRVNSILADAIIPLLNNYFSSNRVSLLLEANEGLFIDREFINSDISFLLYTESQIKRFKKTFDSEYDFIKIADMDFNLVMHMSHPLANESKISFQSLLKDSAVNYHGETVYGMNITDQITYNFKYPFQYIYSFKPVQNLSTKEIELLREDRLSLSYSINLRNRFAVRTVPPDCNDIVSIPYEHPFCGFYAVLKKNAQHYDINAYITETLSNIL